MLNYCTRLTSFEHLQKPNEGKRWRHAVYKNTIICKSAGCKENIFIETFDIFCKQPYECFNSWKCCLLSVKFSCENSLCVRFCSKQEYKQRRPWSEQSWFLLGCCLTCMVAVRDWFFHLEQGTKTAFRWCQEKHQSQGEVLRCLQWSVRLWSDVHNGFGTQELEKPKHTM